MCLSTKVTPRLFEKYPTPQALAEAPLEDMKIVSAWIGLYHNKAKSIQGLARGVVGQFGGSDAADDGGTDKSAGSWPQERQRHYVGVLRDAGDRGGYACGTCFQAAGLAAPKDTVLEVEKKLMRKLPKAEWSHAHHLFIFFGRYFCKAKNPQCPDCPFTSFCREYKAQQKQAEKLAAKKAAPVKAKA